MKKTVCLIALFFLFLFSCNSLQNPYKEGKYSYEKHCADCHGVQGEGLGQPDNVSNKTWRSRNARKQMAQ